MAPPTPATPMPIPEALPVPWTYHSLLHQAMFPTPPPGKADYDRLVAEHEYQVKIAAAKQKAFEKQIIGTAMADEAVTEDTKLKIVEEGNKLGEMLVMQEKIKQQAQAMLPPAVKQQMAALKQQQQLAAYCKMYGCPVVAPPAPAPAPAGYLAGSPAVAPGPAPGPALHDQLQYLHSRVNELQSRLDSVLGPGGPAPAVSPGPAPLPAGFPTLPVGSGPLALASEGSRPQKLRGSLSLLQRSEEGQQCDCGA